MDAVSNRKRKFITSLAASAVALMVDGDMDFLLKPKRRHRFWQRSWLKDREDETQINTIMKLQNQLLKVGSGS